MSKSKSSGVPAFAAEIVCILDRSGSMHSMVREVIGGYNNFIKEQLELGPGSVTLVLFDDQYEIVYEDQPLATVPKLTDKVYFDRGATALNDAIGKTINWIRERHLQDGAPEKTVVLIITDGAENASQEFTEKGIVAKMVAEAEEDGWQFFFIGANVDAFAEASAYGIGAQAAMAYAADDAGVKHAFAAASGATSMARTSQTGDSAGWTLRTDFDTGDEDGQE